MAEKKITACEEAAVDDGLGFGERVFKKTSDPALLNRMERMIEGQAESREFYNSREFKETLKEYVRLVVHEGYPRHEAAQMAWGDLDKNPARLAAKEVVKSAERSERFKLNMERMNDPVHTREALLSDMWQCAIELREKGEYKEAANVWKSLAEILGWTEQSKNANIMANLSHKELMGLLEKFSAGEIPGKTVIPPVN